MNNRAASLERVRDLAPKGDALVDKLSAFWDDPEGYALSVFPWGQAGTPLAKYPEGPDVWQRQVMREIRDQIRGGVKNVRIAISSGHGIGKGALISWLVKWFMSTRGDPQVVVTANTGKQLNTKTWRELAKWNRLALDGHWYHWTATKFAYRGAPETWFAAAIEWSEHNAEAFAGTHEENLMYCFDEASAIADTIWETSEGAMTQPNSFWIVTGNPTKNSGRFRQCWTRFRKRWTRWNIDARDCRMSSQNKELHQQWVHDYGEDSDFVRVRMRGMFPRVSAEQFIGTYLVEEAQARKIERDAVPAYLPRLMGFDPGAGGEETSCMVCIQGPLLIPESVKRWSLADTMALSAQFAHQINLWKPDVVFIDAHGIGQSVYYRLVQLGFEDQVIPVYWGSREEVSDKRLWYNQRVESWGRLREWLKTASIPYDVDMETDLTEPLLEFDAQMRMLLESKDSMKARGVSSPHAGDAMALCFSYPTGTLRRREDVGVIAGRDAYAATEPPVG